MFYCFVFRCRFLVFCCFCAMASNHRAEGGKCSMEVLPRMGGSVYTSFFDWMAVSVSVADLGALATDGLICCAFVGVVVFKFVASATGNKFSVLHLLALWRSYFDVKSIQAISDDGVGCFSVFTYYFYDVKIVFYLLYLNVVYFRVWSGDFVLDFNCWTVTYVPAQSGRHITILSAVIFGEGTGAKLIFASSCRPLCETRESIVVCMSVVMEKFPLFRSRKAIRKQLSLVCVVWKISSCVGFGNVLSFGLSVSRSLVVLVPPSGGGGASRV